MALEPDVEGLLLKQTDVPASQAHSVFKPAELSTPGWMMSSAANRIALWLESSLGVINHWIPFIGTTGELVLALEWGTPDKRHPTWVFSHHSLGVRQFEIEILLKSLVCWYALSNPKEVEEDGNW